MLAAMVAICQAIPEAMYEPLSSPVLDTFEEAIKSSIATVQPPPFEYPNKESLMYEVERDYYDNFLYQFQNAKDLYRKLHSMLQITGFRSKVAKDVLNNMKDKLNVNTSEEAKEILLEACKGLKDLVELILDEEHANLSRHKEFLNGNERQLKAYNLSTFCKIL